MLEKLKKQKIFYLIVFVLFVLFGFVFLFTELVFAAPAPLANTPWPTLGQNQKRTYQSPNTGPTIKPDADSVSSLDLWAGSFNKWTYPPVIGTDGTIYTVGDYSQLPNGSFTANLIALDPSTLTRKWTKSLAPDANSRCSSNETRLYLVGSPVVARKGSQDIIYIWELNYDIVSEEPQCQVLLAFEDNGTRHKIYQDYITSPTMVHWNEDFNPAILLGPDGVIYFKTESKPGGEPNTRLYLQAIRPTDDLNFYTLLWRREVWEKPAGTQYPTFPGTGALSAVDSEVSCIMFTVIRQDASQYYWELRSESINGALSWCGTFVYSGQGTGGMGGSSTPLIHSSDPSVIYWLPAYDLLGSPSGIGGYLYKLDFTPPTPPVPSWQLLDYNVENIMFGNDIIAMKQDFPNGGAVDNNNVYRVDLNGLLYGPWGGTYNLGNSKPGYTIIDTDKTLWIASGSKLFRVKEGKDFSLSAQTPITAYPTDIKTSTITITSLNGFNQNVTLSAQPSNACLTTSFSQNPVLVPAGGSVNSNLNINLTTCPVGNYTITVQGDGLGGTPTHQTTITVQVGVTLIVGNTSGYAWNENLGWISLNCDHRSLGRPKEPTANCAAQGGTDYGALVENTELSGFIWGENIGWISLNCSNDASCATVNYSVTNDNGVLGGYAWGEQIGWIDFNPVGDERVLIDPETGIFSGFAWGENIGWIIFGDGTTYQGETVWRGILGQLSKPANLHHTNNPEIPLKIIWVWDNVDNATGYEIYLLEFDAQYWPIGTATAESFELTKHTNNPLYGGADKNQPLSYNTQYKIRIKAVDSDGAPPNYTDSDLTDPNNPKASAYTSAASPIALSGTIMSKSQIRWIWQSGGGESDFYAQNTQGGSKDWTTDLFWDQSGLSCGQNYILQVKARNADSATCISDCTGDETVWAESAPASITTLIGPLNFILSDITDTSIKLTWDDILNEKGYIVERAEGEDAPGIYSQIYDTQAPDITLYNDTGLTQNTHYWYRVKAYSSIACDSGYAEADARTKGPKLAINPTTYPIGYLEDHYNFGVLEPNKTKSISMLICNLGETDLVVSSASISGDGSANFSFTPPDSSFTLGVDSDYHNCDSSLKGPIEKPAKHEVVIKFTSQLSCDPGPITSQADFILQNNDADKTVGLKGVCQESPVGESEASENIIYDGRIMANPPPAFVEFLEKLQFSEKIKPR